MAKIIKKKFFEIDIPLIGGKFEALANSLEDLNNKTIKIDMTRQLKGKGVEVVFNIKVAEGEQVHEDNPNSKSELVRKATGYPKTLTLISSFIKHMLHTGIDYVEDSITAETKDSVVIVKPFLITRKKVSRAVRRTLRNSAKNWLVDYLKTKNDDEVFNDILSNQLQKPLSMKLKKTYPLAICEIRIFAVKKPISAK